MAEVTGTLSDDTLDLGRLVQPVRRRLGFNVALRWILRGAATTLIGIAIVVALSHITPWPGWDPLGSAAHWIVAIAVSGVVATTAVAWISRPSKIEAIRVADRKLGLKDRLATAYEFAHEDSAMMRLQRNELYNVLEGKKVGSAVALKAPAREIAAALLAILLAAAALLSPNPQATSAATHTQSRRVTTFAAAAVRHLIAQQHPSPPPKADKGSAPLAHSSDPMLKLLRNLASKLQAAESQRAALKSLASTLAQVRQLAATAIKDRQALQSLAGTLASGATKSLSAALRAGDQQATKRALQKLQASIGAMSPSERANLAHTLDRAANVASPSIKQALRQASFALGNNDPTTARQAIKDLAQQLARAQTSASTAPTITLTARQLAAIQRNVANGVARPQPKPANPGPSASQNAKRGASTPAGASAASARVPGAKRGSQSKPSAGGQPGGTPSKETQSAGSASKGATAQSKRNQSTRTAAQGATGSGSPKAAVAGNSGSTVSGSGSSQGGAGSGRGSGASGAGSPGASSHAETVYLPGKRSAGPGVTEDGPLGSSIAITSPAFQRVVSQYSRAANAALGRVALPPSLQGAVKQYFAALQQ